MITNLPSDLMEDIISRVPLKSTRSVRLTCKRWNTLSKSQMFAKMHFGKALAPTNEGESRMIVMMEDNLYLMSIFVNDVNYFSAEQMGQLTCLDEQVKISNVFHCEGLLLCILEDDDTRVVVWNPYCGQTRWIELRDPHVLCGKPELCNMFSYALGYDNKRSCRNHKLLRFIDIFLNNPWNQFVLYEIYDFESGLWTTLNVTPNWRIEFGDYGVSLRGNTYWRARKRNSRDRWTDGVDHIICFDYTRERFGPLLSLPYGISGHLATLSCVREEKLAALCQVDERDPYWSEIWITTMIEAEKVSWSKFLTFNPVSLPDDIVIRLTPSFYIDEVKKVAMFCGNRLYCHIVCIIGEDGYKGEVNLEEGTEDSCLASHDVLCSYVPSLVQIKKPKDGQRERKQSDLEKLRHDEMMSRLSLFERRCKTLEFS